MRLPRRFLPIILAVLVLLPALAGAAGVQPLFDLSSPAGGPFPSDRFTELDPRNITLLRVNLPKPDCAVRVSDCADLDVINTLDGFNLQPRLSIPFSGPIDVTSVNSSNVFLVRLGDARGGPGGQVVGINQVVWDPITDTLHAESDELLDQHTRYLLVVTTGVRDASGDPIGREAFDEFLDRRVRLHDPGSRSTASPSGRRWPGRSWPGTRSPPPASSRPRAPRRCSRRSGGRSRARTRRRPHCSSASR